MPSGVSWAGRRRRWRWTICAAARSTPSSGCWLWILTERDIFPPRGKRDEEEEEGIGSSRQARRIFPLLFFPCWNIITTESTTGREIAQHQQHRSRCYIASLAMTIQTLSDVSLLTKSLRLEGGCWTNRRAIGFLLCWLEMKNKYLKLENFCIGRERETEKIVSRLWSSVNTEWKKKQKKKKKILEAKEDEDVGIHRVSTRILIWLMLNCVRTCRHLHVFHLRARTSSSFPFDVILLLSLAGV